MADKKEQKNIYRYLNFLTAAIALGFTFFVAGSLVWNVLEEREDTEVVAKREAVVSVNKDEALRSWATRHGGVYVPTTEETPPNPYLSYIPDRDITLPSGKRLTLMNPAYIVRQTIQGYEDTHGVKGRITSLKLINPLNTPDQWERKALEAFEKGAKEVAEVVEVNGKPHLRFMRPVITEAGCLKCHASQGYKEGDIRGGIGVSIPMGPYLAVQNKAAAGMVVSHSFIWLMGMAVIGVAYLKGRKIVAERERVSAALAEQSELLEAVFDNSLTCFAILDREFNFIRVNEAYASFDERSVADFPGRNHFELYPSDAQAIFEEVVATGQPFSTYARPFVYPYHPERGVSYWDWTLVPIKDEEGRVDKLIFTLHNVTERERAEQEVREQKDFLSKVIESLAHPFYVVNANDYTIALANSATGAGVESGKSNCYALTHGNDKPCANYGCHCPLEAVKETKKPVTAEHTHYDQAGNPSLYEIHGYPILDPDGNVSQMIEYVLDITERKAAEEKVKRHMENIAALRLIDMAITGSLDLSVTLHVLLQQTVNQLKADAACVLLLNPHDRILEYASSIGFTAKHITHAGVRLGKGYAGLIATERKTRVIPERADEGNAAGRGTLFRTEHFKAYVGVPLIAKGSVKGVLEIFHRSPLRPDQEWIDFAEALAGQAAIAIENAELFENLQRSHSELLLAYDTTIEGWSRALDYRDKETEGHSQRVAEMAIRLARAAGIVGEQLVHVRRGALLHDIGKLGVPDHVLLKPGKLTDEETAMMKQHPEIAYKLIAPIGFLHPSIDIPYCHHEKWDGSGYPRGLRGDEIPIAARLFAIIDVWDALRSDRPYRKAWSLEQAWEYVSSEAGRAFDPKVVDLFVKTEAATTDLKR